MKRAHCLLLTALAVLTAASCAKRDDEPEKEQPNQTAGDDSQEPQQTATVDEVLDQVAAFYSGVDSFRVESELTSQFSRGPFQNKNTVEKTLVAKRPNRLSIRQKQQAGNDVIVSDGQKLVTYMEVLGKYTERDAPPSFDAIARDPLSRSAFGPLGTAVLSLLQENPKAAILENVTSSEYVGREELEGQSVHHLRLSQPQFDVELWVAAEGDPILRQVSATGSSAPGRQGVEPITMTHNERFTGWQINPSLADDTFAFSPPEDAEKVASFFEQPGGRGQSEGAQKPPSSGNPLTDLFRAMDRGLKSLKPAANGTPDEATDRPDRP